MPHGFGATNALSAKGLYIEGFKKQSSLNQHQKKHNLHNPDLVQVMDSQQQALTRILNSNSVSGLAKSHEYPGKSLHKDFANQISSVIAAPSIGTTLS